MLRPLVIVPVAARFLSMGLHAPRSRPVAARLGGFWGTMRISTAKRAAVLGCGKVQIQFGRLYAQCEGEYAGRADSSYMG